MNGVQQRCGTDSTNIVRKARRILGIYGTGFQLRYAIQYTYCCTADTPAFFLFGLLDIPTVRTNALSCIMTTNYMY